MIKAGISIPDIDGGKVNDTLEKYGLIYISSDNILGAPNKGFDTTAYPEEEGEHILPITVDDAFDYKVTFLVNANGKLATANGKIAEFNRDICTVNTTTGRKEYKTISLYNYYKRVKIVGIPSPISSAESFWRDPSGLVWDVVEVTISIRVTKPSECDFNLVGE